MDADASLTHEIISSAIEVHRTVGPGLLESACEECLCRELEIRNIRFARQVPLPVDYKGTRLDCGYRIDFVIEDMVVIELKAVRQLEKIHEAQLLTYLRLAGKKLGLLLNFNVFLMKNGIKRIANGV